MRATPSSAALMLIALTACGGEKRPVDPPRLVAAIDLRLGTEDESREEFIFGVIDGLVFDESGRIYVADSKDHSVRAFSADGQFLYRLGREGHGPGDLSGPCCLMISGDNVLWVKENGNHRYSAFQLNETGATFLSTLRGSASYVVSADRVDFDPAFRLIDLGLAYDPATESYGVVRWRLDSTGVAVAADTVPSPPKDSLGSVSFPSGGGFATYSQPYGAASLQAFGAGGESARGVSSKYAVLWLDAAGAQRTLAVRDLTIGPELSRAEHAATDSMLNAIAAGAGMPRRELPLVLPARKAVLDAIGLDLDGRLWIERAVADGQPGEADVYDRQGRWSATYQWPSNVTMRPWAIRGRTGLAIEEGADGAQRVVRVLFR